MAFNVGAIYGELSLDTSEFTSNLSKATDTIKTKTVAIGTLLGNLATDAVRGIAATIGNVGRAAIGFLGEASQAAIQFENTMKGLATVANATGEGFDAAKMAAQSLAQDGLITVGEAAESLKTLLASGFSVAEATQLINAMKDSAAFNGAAHLSMGEAISTAAVGIKNQNSELIDNVGITKNASKILEEYGFKLEDMTAGADGAAARQAFLNGFLKEAEIFSGDAGRAAETLAGKQGALDNVVKRLKESIGRALNPVLLKLLDMVTPLVEKTTDWFESMEVPIAEALAAAVERLFEALGIDEARLIELLGQGFELMKKGIDGLPDFVDQLVVGFGKLVQIIETSGDAFALIWNAIKVGVGEVGLVATEVVRGVGNVVGANTTEIERFSDNLRLTTREAMADTARSFNDLFELQETQFGRDLERSAAELEAREQERLALREKQRILEAINREGGIAQATLQGGDTIVNINNWPPVTTGNERFLQQSQIERRRQDTGQRGEGPPPSGETP